MAYFEHPCPPGYSLIQGACPGLRVRRHVFDGNIVLDDFLGHVRGRVGLVEFHMFKAEILHEKIFGSRIFDAGIRGIQAAVLGFWTHARVA
jgi:hypothetical protein